MKYFKYTKYTPFLLMLFIIIIQLFLIHKDLTFEYDESEILKFDREMIQTQEDAIRIANDIILFNDTSRLEDYRYQLQKIENLWEKNL